MKNQHLRKLASGKRTEGLPIVEHSCAAGENEPTPAAENHGLCPWRSTGCNTRISASGHHLGDRHLPSNDERSSGLGNQIYVLFYGLLIRGRLPFALLYHDRLTPVIWALFFNEQRFQTSCYLTFYVLDLLLGVFLETAGVVVLPGAAGSEVEDAAVGVAGVSGVAEPSVDVVGVVAV